MKAYRLALMALAGLLALALRAGAAGEKIQLAAGGQAKMVIAVGPKASERVRAAAGNLAKYLDAMSGASFRVVSVGAEVKPCLALGLASDFPAAGEAFDAADPARREDYIIRTHPDGAWLIGASDLAVEHAAWDLLYRLGYRQFFPAAHWEVIPHSPELSLALDTRQHPAYYARRIWYGYGLWDYNKQPYEEWCAKNRATSGIELSSGHVYDGILKANKAEFEKHPEYLGLFEGKRQSTKFCISNPALRKLIVEDALRRMEKDPGKDSLSMEPSDGGKWCECPECAKLGNVTDRALTLANEVAAAIGAKYPGKLVGLYAYNYHSAPPSIEAAPNVVVSLATAFIKGGTWEEMIGGWSGKAKMLGIREYYGVNVWDRDLPAAGRGGNIDYLKRTIPDFYAKGARFMSAESSDNWGPNGLGYYLASRMLWDVGEAKNADALIEDFLQKAFGPAAKPMREFYNQLDGAQPHLVAADQLGRMFRALGEARTIALSNPGTAFGIARNASRSDTTPRIDHVASGGSDLLARLNDLLLYARYVDLYTRYSEAKGEARQQAFEALIRHAYRMRATMLIHARGLTKDLPNRDKTVKMPKEAAMTVPEGKNPWKSSAPFTAAELDGFLKEGIERYQITSIDFKPVTFGEDLVGAAGLKLAATGKPGMFGAGRGRQVFLTRVDKAPATIELAVTGGLIAHYRNRGNVRIELFKIGGASQSGEKETSVALDRSVPPDGNEHAVKIEVKEPGLYKMALEDGNDRTLLKWNCALPLVIPSTLAEPMNKNYTDLWNLYFYVPRGTKDVVIFGGEHGDLCDSQMRPVFFFNGREANYYSIKVPEGEDGKLWCLRNSKGPKCLLTVPPYFARSAGEILIPAEVAKKDAGQ